MWVDLMTIHAKFFFSGIEPIFDLKMTLKRQKIVWDEENSNEIIAVHSKSKPTTPRNIPRMPETEIKRILTTPSRGKSSQI